VIGLDEALGQLKSGDLVLFQARDASILRRTLMCGRYTHVGLVYRQGNQVYVLDAGDSRALNLFVPLLNRYENSETRGLIAVRSISPSLTVQQEAEFRQYINQMRDETKLENGGGGLTMNEATGEWHGLASPVKFNASQAVTQTIPLCASNHIFNQNVGFDKHVITYLCTDGLMDCMKQMRLIDSKNVLCCLLPNYFASNRGQDNLNQCLIKPFQYSTEVRVTCNFC
jgi:serine/threonine protein phosphatase PrpC